MQYIFYTQFKQLSFIYTVVKIKRSLMLSNRSSVAVNQRRTDNITDQKKTDSDPQTSTQKNTNLTKKTVVDSGVPEGWACRFPLVAPVVLFLLHFDEKSSKRTWGCVFQCFWGFLNFQDRIENRKIYIYFTI